MTITSDILKPQDIPEKILVWMHSAPHVECTDTLPISFHGEWVPADEDLDKAMIYLDMWKHFICKKMDKQPVCEKRIYRPAFISAATLGIKLGFYDSESSPETKP